MDKVRYRHGETEVQKKKEPEAGDLMKWVKTVTTLAKVWGLVISIHRVAQFQGP